MIRPIAISFAAALSLLTASVCGADEPHSVTHNEPITVRILSGKDGQPLAHSHLILIGGYDQDEIHDQLWREETLTDAHGQASLSKQFANLPWLQVWVDKKPLCQANPRKTSFSVERIRRDGLSAPNRCGTATVEDAPGVFTVFVRTGKKDTLAKSAVVDATAPKATPTALAPPLPATPVALPVMAVSAPKTTAPRVDLEGLATFSFPASGSVAVSAGKPAQYSARRPASRIVRHKVRRALHRARRTSPACPEQKPATKPAPKPVPAKASAKTASKPIDTKNKAAKAPEKKIDQKPKPATGSKPATPSAPTKQK
jgi:hypothetical protein